MAKLNKNQELSLEEMDKVSGGNWGETGNDSQFLNDMGLAGNRYGGFKAMLYWGEVSSMVDSGYAKGGITCVTRPGSSLENRYYIGETGKEVSQFEAMSYVANKLGKKVDLKKYGYDPNPMWNA